MCSQPDGIKLSITMYMAEMKRDQKGPKFENDVWKLDQLFFPYASITNRVKTWKTI